MSESGKYPGARNRGGVARNRRARIREMCDKLLANTVIEDYRFEIQEYWTNADWLIA